MGARRSGGRLTFLPAMTDGNMTVVSTTTDLACGAAAAAAANLRVEELPFEQVPRQSRLFLDYLRDPDALRRYYPNAVRRQSEFDARVPEVLAAAHADRRSLCDALQAMNARWGATGETLANVARLRAENAVAVVSGQQAGLFTGPLYTLYKALSAVKLAECLTNRGVEAVPVFWMATEDHDWEEVRAAHVVSCEGRLAEVSLPAEAHREGAPVGGVIVGAEIDGAIKNLFARLPSTEFTDELEALLRDCYQPGRAFGEAFARMLTKLVGRRGLILLDPLDPALKRLAAPVYADAARRAPELAAAVGERSRALERNGYHAQVHAHADSFPLFFHDDEGARRALARTAEGRYRVKGDDAPELTAGEWAARAEDEPARFSPNVTLRAVVQDYLLPTLAYFGGAAEIAYFAQTAEVYRLLNRPATTILHRASLTLVERRAARTLARYGLRLSDFFEGSEAVVARVVEEHLGAETARAFDRAEGAVGQALDELHGHLRGFDPTLADALTHGRRKIEYQLAGLRSRFRRAQALRDRAAVRQLERAAAALYPEGELQERRFNVTSLVARHGLYCLDWLYGAVNPDSREHAVVYL